MTNEGSGEKQKAMARLATRIMVGGTILVAAIAAGWLAFGCGGNSDNRSAAVAPSEQVYPVSQPGGEAQSPAHGPRASLRAAEQPAVPADSLAPDVAVSVADTLVLAGVPIEIEAEGSADVTTLTLADGIHQPQLFTQDHNTGLWRTMYRVPLRPRSDHIGLSVTARNGAGRWRRVWVFLRLQEEQPEATADTTVDK